MVSVVLALGTYVKLFLIKSCSVEVEYAIDCHMRHFHKIGIENFDVIYWYKTSRFCGTHCLTFLAFLFLVLLIEVQINVMSIR